MWLLSPFRKLFPFCFSSGWSRNFGSSDKVLGLPVPQAQFLPGLVLREAIPGPGTKLVSGVHSQIQTVHSK